MRSILLGGLLALSFSAHSQTEGYSDDIPLAIVMPNNADDNMGEQQFSVLKSRLTQAASNAGMAAMDYSSSFAVCPKIAVTDASTVEGGMEAIQVVSFDVTFSIKEIDNNLVFASTTKHLKGSGKTKQAALSNGFSKIDPQDREIASFFSQGKQKIVAYYQTKCAGLITQADHLNAQRNYEAALGILMSVPSEVSCYAQVQEKAVSVFKAYQNQQCSKTMQKAKAEIAATNYSSALSYLQDIDPGSNCNNDANALIKSIGNKVTETQRQQYELTMKIYNDDRALQKWRLQAMKEVAIEYYKSRPKAVIYAN
ncbi:hypothetical protein [Taibaiella soli]|uniref:Tetratricopeptide repeat protein n=1 Tax=Taibaiella soli TaxID=1649169 RepID=A0A2W2AGM0_9BACT|nr:hypothetical protein [Taibaiella soli]PZF72672.1 hypothetical protein DN068_12465 [Taibaiella soli]